MEARSDQQLMLAAGRGDQRAFEALVVRHRKRAVGFCLRMVGDVHAAEDLAQEAFARLYLMRQRYEPRAKFATLLYRVLRNLAVDELRRRNRWAPPPADAARAGPAGQLGRIADHSPAAQPEPEALRRDTAEAVRQALGRLAPDHRAALMLREFEGLEYRQIAEVMDWTLAKTKVTIHRAKRQLAAQLAEEDLDVEDD